MLVRRNPGYTLFAMSLDALITLATLLMATSIRLSVTVGAEIGPEYALPLGVIVIITLIWCLVFSLLAVYDSRRNYRFVDEAQRVLTASLFALLAISGALYFSERMTSRLLVIYFFVLNVITLIGWRALARVVARLTHNLPHHRVMIIGANEFGRQTADALRDFAGDQVELIGFVDETNPLQLPLIGNIEAVEQIVRDQGIDEVIVALPYSAYDHLHQIIPALHAYPVQIRVAPNYVNLALHRANVEEFGGLAFVNLRDPALTPGQRLLKRAFDLIACAALMPFALPLMGFIGLLIRLDSPGGIIYRQQRVGENGRLFTMYKFRSMIEGADHQRWFKSPDDPRVTRIGAFLRRTSLDEMPQLLNVLKGEMSLVGPRPEMPWLVEKYEPWQRKRFAVPQGMTGWWQVNGRSSRPMHQHTEDDLYYIQNYSLLLDVIILWKTLFAVISRKGAY